MNRIAPALSLFFAVLILASCQTLSKDECVAADWRVIGEQDGSDGREPQKRFGKHVKACEKAGVIPDQTAWNEGYQRGLFNFCTPQRGLSHGQSGKSYKNVCPPALEQGFLSGYRLGAEENAKKAAIRRIESNIRTAENEIRSTEELISKGKIDQLDGESTIRRKRDDIRRYNREIGRAEADLGEVQRRVEFFQRNPNIGGTFN